MLCIVTVIVYFPKARFNNDGGKEILLSIKISKNDPLLYQKTVVMICGASLMSQFSSARFLRLKFV